MSMQAIFNSVVVPQGNLTSTLNTNTDVHMPSHVFESIIPGYGPIHSFILLTFGIDITILVTLFATIWAFCKVGIYAFGSFYRLIAENYICSVNISSCDDIYKHLMVWLADQPRMKTSRSLMAETTHKTASEADDEDLKARTNIKGCTEPGTSGYLNFSNQKARAPPRFIPAFGTQDSSILSGPLPYLYKLYIISRE